MQPNLTLGRSANAAMIALVVSITIAACGGSSPSGSSAASTASTGLKYAACIRADGVPDYPDPSSGTGGESIDQSPDKISVNGHALAESPQVVQTAMSKCEKYSPIVQGPATSTGELAKLRAKALVMAKCMRAHGVPSYPDPTVKAGPAGHGIVVSLPGGINASAPAVEAAQKKCSW